MVLEADAAIELLQTSNLITADMNADGQLSLHEFTVLLIQNDVTDMTMEGVKNLYESIVADGQTSIVVADFDTSNNLISNVDATLEELLKDTGTILEETATEVDNTLENVEVAVEDTINNIDGTFKDFVASIDKTLFDTDGDGSINLLESTVGLDSNGITAVVATDNQITALKDLINISTDGTVSVADLEASLDIEGASVEAEFNIETGGVINVQEFVYALNDAEIVSLTIEETNALLTQLQESVDNSIQLTDLETVLADLDVINSISESFQTFLDNLDLATVLDVDGDGSTNLLESTIGLDGAGINAFVATDAQINAIQDILASASVDGIVSLEEVQAAINIDGEMYADVFFDAETGGSINIEEFLHGLTSGGIVDVSVAELNTLVTDLDATVDNVLNLQDLETTLTAMLDNISDDFQTFLDNLDVSSTNLLDSTLALGAAGVSEFVSTDVQVTALRDILNTNVDADISIADLQAAVAVDGITYADVTFDAETGGSINLEELLFSLEASGIANLSSDELSSLVADLEASVDNVLNLQDLETTLTAALDNISDNFKTFLESFDISSVIDGDGDGSIDLLDSAIALDAAGVTAFVATDTQVTALQDLADIAVDGTVSLTDLQAVIAIDGATYADVTFDANAGGSVNIEELLLGLKLSGIVDVTLDELDTIIAGLDGGSLTLTDLTTFLEELDIKYVGTTLADIRTALDNVDANLITDIGNLDLAIFDSNDDGILDKVELETGLITSGITGYTSAQLKDLYVSLDVDGDGKVAFAEIELPRIFEALGTINVADFDHNLDGDLNIFEFFNAIATGGITDLTLAEIELMFDYLDVDGDLAVSVNDLSVAIEIPEFLKFEHCGTINLYELGRRIANLDADLDLSTTAGVDALMSIVDEVSVDIEGVIENAEAIINEVVTDVEATIDNLVENVVEPTVEELVDTVDTTIDNVIESPAVENVVDTVDEIVGLPVSDEVVDVVDTTLDNTLDAVDTTVDNVVDTVTDGDITVEEVVDLVDTTVDTTVDLADATIDEVVDVVDAVDEVVDTPVDEVVTNVDTTVDTIVDEIVDPTVDNLLDVTDPVDIAIPIDLSSPLLNQDLIASLEGLDVSDFDQDGSGNIDLVEFTIGMMQNGISASVTDIVLLLKTLDTDGDLLIVNSDFISTFGSSR